MSSRSGCRALAHRRRTLPGVSSPESVVRSISVMARSSHAACHSFLTVRRVGMRRGTALDGAAIDADRAHDVEVERHPGIALDVIRREAGAAM